MMLKIIWHSADEKPDDCSTIITSDGAVGQYEYDAGRETIYCPAGHIEFLGHHGKWHMRWAYLDDVLTALGERDMLAANISAILDYIDVQSVSSLDNNYNDTAVAFRKLGDYIRESLREYIKNDDGDTE